MSAAGTTNGFPPKPEIIRPNLSGMPKSLTRLNRWVGWRLTLGADKKDPTKPRKWTKPPYQANGRLASHSDAGTWQPFGSIVRAYKNGHDFDGIGVVLGPLNTSDVLFGVDLDACLRDDGTMVPWAKRIADVLNVTYGEYSPSKTGVKFLGIVPSSVLSAVRSAFWFLGDGGKITMGPAVNGANHPPGVEIYFNRRFFTMTGTPWPESAPEVTWFDGPTLRHVAELLPKPKPKQNGAAPGAGSAAAGHDNSRSARAFNMGAAFRRNGGCFEDLEAHLRTDPLCAAWLNDEYGRGYGEYALKRIWKRTGGAEDQRSSAQRGDGDHGEPDPEMLENPDMRVMRQYEREPPRFPIELFGEAWARWANSNAEAAAGPVDYVMAIIPPTVGTLLGNARWALATPDWSEPPAIWAVAVSPSGDRKSPGADVTLKRVIPEFEHRMARDFPEQRRQRLIEIMEWKDADEAWQTAAAEGDPLPEPPEGPPPPEPQMPRIKTSDITIEKLATLLSDIPKGLMLVRDELAGWLMGMNIYNASGRQFWIECYGGRPYTLERQKYTHPILIPRLTTSIYGTIQPEKLAEIARREPDDGLLPRMLYFWQHPKPFQIGREAVKTSWAIDALDRLRRLELRKGERGLEPVYVPLTEMAQNSLEAFGQLMDERKELAGGMLRSAYGKAPGFVLRLALIMQFMWWAADDNMPDEPTHISKKAVLAAARLVAGYFMPMAARVFGDADSPEVDKHAATIARWIIRERQQEVHVRKLQRGEYRGGRLPGLRDAPTIRAACRALVEAGWLIPPETGYGSASKVEYQVNPRVHHLIAGNQAR
jgi:hypothetical protein